MIKPKLTKEYMLNLKKWFDNNQINNYKHSVDNFSIEVKNPKKIKDEFPRIIWVILVDALVYLFFFKWVTSDKLIQLSIDYPGVVLPSIAGVTSIIWFTAVVIDLIYSAIYKEKEVTVTQKLEVESETYNTYGYHGDNEIQTDSEIRLTNLEKYQAKLEKEEEAWRKLK